MKVQQLPSVNGWRAVSILLVLGYHTSMMTGVPPKLSHFFGALFDGNLGVRFFFTISGFLITWLMLKEEAEFGQVSLKNFYIRRTLRIWPVYLSYVALLGVLQMFGILVQDPFAWRGLLTFTRNFFDPMSETYVDDASGHCWSLSIEEQFYFFWPLIFLLLKTRGRIWFLIAAILFSIGFRTIDVLGLYDRHAHVLFQKYSTFNFLDWLSWGCLGAFWLTAWRSKLEELFKKYSLIIFPVGFVLVLVPFLISFGQGFQALGFVVLLLHSVVSPNGTFYRILNFKWMNQIGILSYSIYIWHQPIWMMWPKLLGAVWFLWIPVLLGVSCISYEYLEKPFFALRSKYRDPNSNLLR